MVLITMLVGGCFWGDEYGEASAAQITEGLTNCDVQTKDFARDDLLDGRYLIIYHKGEPDHERKIECVSSYLEARGVSATGIYPGPVNREGLH